MHAGRQAGVERLNLLVHFIGDREGVAVRLAIDVEKHGGFSVGGDHGIDRSNGSRDSSDIAHANGNSSGGSFDHDLAEFVGRMNLAADQAEHQLVIIFEKAGRIDEIGFFYAVENVRDSNSGRDQARGIGSDLIFRDAAALHDDRGDASEAIKSWLEVVGGDFPKMIGRGGIGSEAVTENWERGESQATGFEFCGGGKFRLHAGGDRIHALQSLYHVHVPVEKKIDFSGATAGDGKNALQAGNIVNRFFNRSGNGNQHLVDGHDAVVHANHNAREIGAGKNRNGDAKRQIAADQGQADD